MGNNFESFSGHSVEDIFQEGKITISDIEDDQKENEEEGEEEEEDSDNSVKSLERIDDSKKYSVEELLNILKKKETQIESLTKQNGKLQNRSKKYKDKILQLRRENSNQKYIIKRIVHVADTEPGGSRIQNILLEIKNGEKRKKKILNWIEDEQFREQKVREFIYSEKRYTDSLKLLKHEYLEEFKNQKDKLLPEKIYKKIFAHFDKVYNTNNEFIAKLEKILYSSTSKDEELVQLCLTYFTNFKIYSNYIKFYISSHDLLIQQIKKNKKLENFLNDTTKRLRRINPHIENTLCGLLILPVQRLPRYKLLLQDIKKHTKPGSINYEKLIKSLLQLEEIISFCDEQSKIHRENLNLVALSKELNITLVQKKLLFQCGNIYRVDESNQENIDSSIFIFNDLIIIRENEKNIFASNRQWKVDIHPDLLIKEISKNVIITEKTNLDEIERDIKKTEKKKSKGLSSLRFKRPQTRSFSQLKKKRIKISFISEFDKVKFFNTLKALDLTINNKKTVVIIDSI